MKLDELRKEIDKIDSDIIKLLRRRFEIVRNIARLKKKLGLKIEDGKREKDILKNCKLAAGGLDEGFVEKLMHLILAQSKKIQEEER